MEDYDFLEVILTIMGGILFIVLLLLFVSAGQSRSRKRIAAEVSKAVKQASPSDEPSAETARGDNTVGIVAPRPRKRKEQREYSDLFLERLAPMPRKHTSSASRCMTNSRPCCL